MLVLLAGCGRVSFQSSDAARGDGGILPPGDTMVNGDAPDSAALFDCRMTHPTAMFCDGFEAPLTDTYDYSVIDNGRAEATTTRAYRGSRALEVETFDVADYKSARWGHKFGQEITSGALHVRAYYWVAGTTTFDEQASLLASGYGVEPYPSVYLRLSPGDVVVNVDQTSYTFTGDIPRDRWVCVELAIAIDPAAGQVIVSYDGAPQFTTPATDTLPGGGFSGVDIGLHYATPNQSPVSMWIDEVIVSTAPIGCN